MRIEDVVEIAAGEGCIVIRLEHGNICLPSGVDIDVISIEHGTDDGIDRAIVNVIMQ